ncbi:hypothetical protein MYCTH_2309722 [Thermothelomyces thermophilus ATCC 42464]|uniref:Uncharacterized protein n=1 Tax=Thermothelomyces thermophilus (strain ATCC 42464 / BCRC 31852 / DSM 1799) TaxID=573729 RepID=G2QMV1_THET4|nr:uncharacterized protein MYCTH_2309722 [Thermothelomyces thermophilus ATCC 42464]AEO60491.1 hypothetical protein MYCTH_2309722 [Thermothelomyces thermophilus ATCC 42464]
MKLAALLASSLLCAGVWAAPATKSDDKSSTSEIDPHHGYVNHEGHTCEIIDEDDVKCRAGPSTEFDIVTTFNKGFKGTFICAEKGKCVLIDGLENCTWDLIYILGVPCYVSGHYTDSECGVAKLGLCSGG